MAKSLMVVAWPNAESVVGSIRTVRYELRSSSHKIIINILQWLHSTYGIRKHSGLAIARRQRNSRQCNPFHLHILMQWMSGNDSRTHAF